MNAVEPGSPVAPQPIPVDFLPPAALRSPHVQSVLASSAVRRRRALGASAALRSASRARVLHCADGTRLEARVSLQRGRRSRGLVVALHGWHGCADSLYLLSTTGALFEAGFDVVRLHLRDHGGTHALNEGLFHSCRIDEAVHAVAEIRRAFPEAPLSLLGFSLGGNFALRIALRAPAAGIELDRVLAVCPVLDPGATMAALDGGWWGYRWYFLRNWRREMDAKRRAFPERYDFTEARALDSLTAMTDWFVERHTPYAGTGPYLDGYTLTGDVLAPLAVPSTILTALDDPVIPAEGLRRLAAPDALRVEVTPHGGHCGFIAGPSLRCWLDEAVVERLGEGAA